MTWLDAITLGLIQGLTEFLPVSSSGHLALGRVFLSYDPGESAVFEVFLHLGTALSILTVFAADVVPLLVATRGLVLPRRWKASWKQDPAFRTVALILLSAVPVACCLPLRSQVEGLFDMPRVVGALLMGTGMILIVGWWAPRGERPVGVKSALIMGVAQAMAILPGISRSGSTIAAGLYSGADRQEVGRFAFLMALVPIFGAAILGLRDLGESGPGFAPVLAGTVVAYVSGVIALKMLLRFVARGRLVIFAPYCILVGLAALIWA